MSNLLSQDEIKTLLLAFDESDEGVSDFARPRAKVESTKTIVGTTLADIARQNVRRKKVVNEPDYLHITMVGGQKYYSCPGSTVLHPESNARSIFDFSKIRGFISS